MRVYNLLFSKLHRSNSIRLIYIYFLLRKYTSFPKWQCNLLISHLSSYQLWNVRIKKVLNPLRRGYDEIKYTVIKHTGFIACHNDSRLISLLCSWEQLVIFLPSFSGVTKFFSSILLLICFRIPHRCASELDGISASSNILGILATRFTFLSPPFCFLRSLLSFLKER